MGLISDSAGESGPTSQKTNDGMLSTITDPLLRVLLAIRGSFLLFVVSVGLLFIMAGVTMMNGVLAGMFGIWGVSCLLYAGFGYGLLKLIGYH